MKWTIPERIIQKGRKYADEKRVTAITQDLSQEVWHAEVIGSEVYRVELDGTPREKDVCTCLYWQDKGYCKHTVAVELALRDKGLNRVLKQNKNLKATYKAPSLSKIFTDSFAKLQDKETNQTLQEVTPLTVEFVVESVEISKYHPEKSVFGLGFKIGFEGGRTYVAKNAHEFLEKFSKQESFRVGDKYQYNLLARNFSETDLNLLNQALKIHESNQMVTNSGIQSKGMLKTRYVLLPLKQVKDFLVLLHRNDKLQLVINEKTLTTLYFSEEKLPLNFEVIPQGEGFVLKIKDQVDMYWETYRWLNRGATFYELSSQQQDIYQTLMQLIKRAEKPEIYYDSEDVADLFSYVLPTLELIGEVVVDSSLQTEMIQVPLKTHFYLSHKKDKLILRVDYCYGEEVFSSDPAFSTATDKTALVVRNQVQENRIDKILTYYGYTQRARGYSQGLPEKAELYRLFSEVIPYFRKIATVEIEASLSGLYLDAVQYQPKIEVLEEGSWLDIRFDVSNIAESDVNNVLISLMNQEKFYQLDSGEVLALDSEAFQQTSEALAKLRGQLNFQDGKFLIPKYRGLQVEEALETVSTTTFSEDFTKMVGNLTKPETLDFPVPKSLNAELREYQTAGYRWLKMLSQYHFGGILADEMGLGKTIQGITYLLSEKEANVSQPSLIVAPASLIYNWQMECEKFAPDLKTVVVTGNKNERELLIQGGDEVDLLITSYASLRQDIEWYQKLSIHCLILDEAQMIKNSATKTFQAIKELKTVHRFALSGTPIENNLEELWSLFYMLMPGFFPSKAKFKNMPTEEIAKMIQPFILRREKKTVLKDLPDKIESNLYSSLTEEQKTVYVAHLRQMQESVAGMTSEGFKKNRISVLAGLTRLRQICCDPRLFIDDFQGDSGKLEQVKELVVAAKENGRRILIFSQFTSMLSIIEEEFAELGIDTFYLRGSTKPKERLNMVEAYNGGEKDVFLISLKAGGTGLNLTGADTVILYDLWWNPAVEEQAAGRAHRMGQKKVVEVWRLIAEGTIEEKMNALQQEKKDLFDKVLNAEEEQQLAKLTEADIREILSIGMD